MFRETGEIQTQQIPREDYETVHSYKSLTFGLIKGSEGILLIKVGLSGSIYGHEKKYLALAARINRLYRFSVIVSSNPLSVPDETNWDITLEYIKAYAAAQPNDQPIYYMGISKGALFGAQFGWKHPKIEKLLLINMPLMINWHKSKAGLHHSERQKFYLLFGESDPSYPYIRFAELLRSSSIDVSSVAGQNHRFDPDHLNAAADRFLFSDLKHFHAPTE